MSPSMCFLAVSIRYFDGLRPSTSCSPMAACHANVGTTQIYADIVDKSKREAVERIKIREEPKNEDEAGDKE